MMSNDNCQLCNRTLYTKTNYLEGQKKYHWEKTKKFTVIVMISGIICLLFVYACVYFILASWFTLFFGCSFSVFWIAIIFSLFFDHTMKVKKHYKKLIQSGTIPERNYCFGEQSVSVTTADSSFVLQYLQISQIFETKHTCVLCDDNSFFFVDLLIIDKEGFTKGTYEELCLLLKKQTTAPWK